MRLKRKSFQDAAEEAVGCMRVLGGLRQCICYSPQCWLCPTRSLAKTVRYFFFLFASARAKFSLTLNFTILRISAKGRGLSRGNLTEPFAPS